MSGIVLDLSASLSLFSHESPAPVYLVSQSLELDMSSLTFEFVVEGVLLFLVAFVGLGANFVAIAVFVKKRRQTFYR